MGGRAGSGAGGGMKWVGGIAPRTVTNSNLPNVYHRYYGKEATFKVTKKGKYAYHVDVQAKGSTNWQDPLGFGNSQLTLKQAKGFVGFLKGIGYKQA